MERGAGTFYIQGAETFIGTKVAQIAMTFEKKGEYRLVREEKCYGPIRKREKKVL